jgi:hypothetical protein
VHDMHDDDDDGVHSVGVIIIKLLS